MLALSVLLPFVLLASLAIADQASRFAEGHGRVELWLKDSPEALVTVSAVRFDDPAFGIADVILATRSVTPPPGCRSAVGLGFRGLRDNELQIAYDILRAKAIAAGLHPCEQPVFVFDDLPGPLDARDPSDFAVQAVLWAAMPTAALGLLFWAAMDRFGLAASLAWSRWDLEALRQGLATGLLLTLAPMALDWLLPPPYPATAQTPGPGFLALSLLLFPLLHELAFRAWALALAMQSHGPRFALFWSSGLQVLINAGSFSAAVQALVSGLLLGRLFLRRQALPECVIALTTCTALRMLAPV
ncbi:CPBP family glutamic-type intramembrane protease [Arenimonas fontis]|uniref:CAAX prenyl protease 2/Lysostaphin resistance protein A-like domain-containing protein n=1 Tax=Arenimonas fontis TaxID=2608255 RepID=A0A5B2ZDB5_9GAMM|nr:CPBP family glutamic-type intramembrane protease [Arenimonas fontis]KAA2286019.1 hypothetical protein F0415_00490 [Arenimonas fontis]